MKHMQCNTTSGFTDVAQAPYQNFSCEVEVFCGYSVNNLTLWCGALKLNENMS